MGVIESLDNIRRAKEQLGYSSDTSQVFLALESTFGPCYIASFEPEGILFIEASILLRLKKDHWFIPYGSIQYLTGSNPSMMSVLTEGSGHYWTLTIKVNGSRRTKLFVSKQAGIGKSDAWVKKNFLKIKSLVEKGELPIGIAQEPKEECATQPQYKGEQLERPLFCTNCGSALGPDQQFCTNCGKRVIP